MSASTDSVADIEAAAPPRPIPEPVCTECGHGLAAHTLIGSGTCWGTAKTFWRDQTPSDCSCVRFAFSAA